MKKQIAYLLACACLIWACYTNRSKDERPRILPNKVAQEEEKPHDSHCTFKQGKNKRTDNTPPFDKTTKIEAISFNLSKFYDDLRAQKKGMDEIETPVKITNGVLFVPHIVNRSTLTPEQVQNLFETLFFNKGGNSDMAKCYSPNEVFVFYEGSKPFAFLELCFGCSGWRNYKTDFKDFCDQKWEGLETFFPARKKRN